MVLASQRSDPASQNPLDEAIHMLDDLPASPSPPLPPILETATSVSLTWQKAKNLTMNLRSAAELFMLPITEQEGSDAILFRHVPSWIRFERIKGFRFRIVLQIHDPLNFIESMHEEVTFLGYPGSSGWADKIGSVAVHYMGPDWFIFSKILPFHKQNEDKKEHKDLLLLGSSCNVMLTPTAIYELPSEFVEPACRVTFITSSGGLIKHSCPIASLSSFSRWRLWLSWGHTNCEFREQATALKVEFDVVERAARKSRTLQFIKGTWLRFLGHIKVEEQLDRYPHEPIDPHYYEMLISTATHQTEDEQRARLLLRHYNTDDDGADESVSQLKLADASADLSADLETDMTFMNRSAFSSLEA